MKILITGAGGMVGSHMIDFFYAQGGNEIVGSYFKPTTDLKDVKGKATLIECDVRYHQNIQGIIADLMPEKIFHLAAQSYPTVSWDRPQETMDINVNGTINVFESIRSVRKFDKNYNPVVVVACSSAEYGASLTPENVPIKEEASLLPLHPYGVSKVGQDLLSYQYYRNDGLRSIRARIFNTTGPRKINDVVSDFTQRAVEIKEGLSDHMRVGNLDTRRAITDVRDLVNALILLSDKGKWGEVYNISGEQVYKIRELIPILESIIGREIETRVDPILIRPTDEPIIFGDSSRLKEHTNWSQQFGLNTTIRDMFDYIESKR